MDITINIPSQRIADLFTTAIESGDPVTTARKGGWCSGIDRVLPSGRLDDKPWYQNASTFERDDLKIQIVEIDDENTGHETKYTFGLRHIREGFIRMAQKHACDLADLLTENDDAATADIFLQLMTFGEVKYD